MRVEARDIACVLNANHILKGVSGLFVRLPEGVNVDVHCGACLCVAQAA